MPLSTTRVIDARMVHEICGLDDDIYRNHWITYAYHAISERMRLHLGDDATWCTFARWSSFTVGAALDVDTPNRRLDDLLTRYHLGLLRGPLQGLNRDLRMLSDAAMPRILAIGNRYVFHDIGYHMTSFLDWYEETKRQFDNSPPIDADEAWEDAWHAHARTITSIESNDFFQDADLMLLEDGLRHYLDAMRATDADHRSNHVLHGNILLAVYEQWRLDPILKIAMDPVAKHLVEFHADNPHTPERPEAVLRRRGTRWAYRHQSALYRWAAEQYTQILTQIWMTYDSPNESGEIVALPVGQGLGDVDARPRGRRIDDADLLKIMAIYDRQRRLRGSATWTRFADRMQFIVELFRAKQNVLALHNDSHLDTEILALEISDATLDHLRQVGDHRMDDFVAAHVLASPDIPDARTLVKKLIRKGLRPELGEAAPVDLDGALPPWHDPVKLERGQEFLREHGLQIATGLFGASLPKSYTAGHGTRVLTATAELASGQINRRIAETGQMLFDLMTKDPDLPTLAPGTAASDAVRGVRLFHAAVRHMLLDRGWRERTARNRNHHDDADRIVTEHAATPSNGGLHVHAASRSRTEPGVPINQEDLLGTLIAFSVMVIDALDEMRVFTGRSEEEVREDKEAYIHLWQVVGYLLGIDYTLIHRADDPPDPLNLRDEGMGNPPSLREMRILGKAIYRRNAEASPDGQALAASLMQMMRDSMGRLGKSVPSTTTRWLIGDESADVLEIPPAEAPARLVLGVVRPITRMLPFGGVGGYVAKLLANNTTRVYNEWITTNRGDRPEWRVDPELRARWGLADAPTHDRRGARPDGSSASPPLARKP